MSTKSLAERTIRIYMDPYVPGLAWDCDEPDYIASGPVGPELADNEAARTALDELWERMCHDLTDTIAAHWDPTGKTIVLTGPADDVDDYCDQIDAR